MFDPASHDFYDRSAVDKELRRVADICHTCRRCYNLCPSFDVLFRALDRPEVDGEVDRLTVPDLGEFSDLCFECKLCIPHCPYYPPHRWEVDIPRLVLRDRAARVKHDGKAGLREKILASTDAVGKLATAAAPIVNALHSTRAVRVVMEKTLGVHRDRMLPAWSPETFVQWWARRGGATEPSARAPRGDRVALFVTCAVNANNPEIGRAAVAVLEKNGCEVVVPPQRCCGMPFLESGDIDATMECRRDNVTTLLPLVRAGYTIVSPGPTCSLTLKKEYPVLGREQEAKDVAAATLDLCEFLMRRHAEGKLSTDFPRAPRKVLYQVPCHLKVQDIGFKSRDLLQLIPGAEVVTVEKCTGHDGTWSMKTEYFPMSMKIGAPVFAAIEAERPDVVATDCPLAGIQIRQGTGATPKHPIQVFAEAYGLREL
ncbi:MAG TPA: anaerobic glycerol-3-phosphate dehydrogenase subunit C [Thermoanaerobaculia bacterium]